MGSGEGGKAEGTLTVSPGRRKNERVKDEGSNDERASSNAEEEEADGTGNGMGVRSASTMERPGCSQYGPVRCARLQLVPQFFDDLHTQSRAVDAPRVPAE